MDIIEINEKLKKEFEQNKNYDNLEKLFMSELLSPIQDYFSAIDLVKSHLDLIKKSELLFIAAYLSSENFIKNNFFIELLDKNFSKFNDDERAIILYLKAYDIICNDRNWNKNKNCFKYLKDSRNYSKDIKFSNNLFYLSNFYKGSKKLALLKEGLGNIVNVLDEKQIERLPDDYFFSVDNYINEFIKGIDISDEVYQTKFQKIAELEKN